MLFSIHLLYHLGTISGASKTKESEEEGVAIERDEALIKVRQTARGGGQTDRQMCRVVTRRTIRQDSKLARKYVCRKLENYRLCDLDFVLEL